jgi:hypothetical protein
MAFTKYITTLQSDNAKATLGKIVTIINESNLTIMDAQNILDLVKASVLTGTVSNIKNPTLDDVVVIGPNKRETPGALLTGSHLRDV